ncbi:uncharacterized protein LOC128668024 [Microplitis demolitor]|uniref:uncharacterized protein LOC128668024 n=1 Tax=Microplitis demolitor TaxID=69319 RepID=UPI00235B5D49|nr:uncharacterized protein LOC128668024 [Microplitis demolitor]
MRKVIKCRIADAKKQYFNQQFHNCKDGKSLWNSFRQVGLIKCSESNISVDLDLSGLNDYFVTVAGVMNGQINYDCLDKCVLISRSVFIFNRLDCETVKRAITRLTSSSKGPDGFEIKVYKILLPYFLCIITELFNLSLSTGDFPSAWRKSYVLPLPKVRSPESFSDYKPISLLCTLSKALERCVHDQIASYLAMHDLEDKYQTAFRPGLNTQDVILKLTDDVRASMDCSMVTVAVFFDFSKAFDSVVFDILIYKLRALGFDETAVSWVVSYLKG